MCQHTTTTSLDDVRCFSGSVAVHPYTDENRSAHGGTTHTERCCACGATRRVNVNQCHVEVGPWGQSEAAQRQQRQQRQREADARLREQEAAESAAVAAHMTRVLEVRDGAAIVEIDSRQQWVCTIDIDAAAVQPDNGDGLVQFYRGLQRLVREAARR